MLIIFFIFKKLFLKLIHQKYINLKKKNFKILKKKDFQTQS